MQYVDPVCGRIVDSNRPGAESMHGTEHYYFCTVACRDRFESNPAQFLGSPRERVDREDFERHEPPRTSIDGITSPKFGAATSGGAEFEPIPERHDRRPVERGGKKDSDLDKG
jgi:YHS domain-containing protein